jgi:hypothetical protein
VAKRAAANTQSVEAAVRADRLTWIQAWAFALLTALLSFAVTTTYDLHEPPKPGPEFISLGYYYEYV